MGVWVCQCVSSSEDRHCLPIKLPLTASHETATNKRMIFFFRCLGRGGCSFFFGFGLDAAPLQLLSLSLSLSVSVSVSSAQSNFFVGNFILNAFLPRRVQIPPLRGPPLLPIFFLFGPCYFFLLFFFWSVVASRLDFVFLSIRFDVESRSGARRHRSPVPRRRRQVYDGLRCIMERSRKRTRTFFFLSFFFRPSCFGVGRREIREEAGNFSTAFQV